MHKIFQNLLQLLISLVIMKILVKAMLTEHIFPLRLQHFFVLFNKPQVDV